MNKNKKILNRFLETCPFRFSSESDGGLLDTALIKVARELSHMIRSVIWLKHCARDLGGNFHRLVSTSDTTAINYSFPVFT